jgi:hypothetical protein
MYSWVCYKELTPATILQAALKHSVDKVLLFKADFHVLSFLCPLATCFSVLRVETTLRGEGESKPGDGALKRGMFSIKLITDPNV